ncbi:Tetratricopeptide TPR_2 repeat protein [Anaeromyxobacter sp. K]|uniref:tetratricopeptide repeat protein n=1 Tax=Anaeromyxobacter sp. (strain K) TaxID=447217 RepID=UPI00015F898E|nr:tetratricopeptide repeat protein [Anaeromyxobacter sp. K]ACG74292.1 Tetratricopeptide TPR_2 repeat protein [Anaeromyxobacter sp. K]
MNRNTVIALVVGLVVGFLIGQLASRRDQVTSVPVVAAPAGTPAMPPGGMGGLPAPMPSPGASMDLQARITAAEQIVAKDPRNVRAWIQLGNDYFDSRQAQKAVEAYGRALELEPNTPDVLTDQGVMYRDLGNFDKAIANFKKANEVDPKHVQSLFNLGVVYLHDLQDADKAAKAWNQVISAAPTSPQAQQAQQALTQLKANPPPPRKK